MRPYTAIALVALALAGCGGGGGDADDVLAETAAKLGDIRSGTLDVGLVVTPRSGEAFGFELSGPFSFGKAGSLPVMDVDYTQIANGRRATATLISTGEKAYARVGDDLTELSAAQTAGLRSAVGELAGNGGLEQLPVGDWVTDAEVSEDDDVDVVRGELDVVATVRGLVELARGFGRDLPRLDDGLPSSYGTPRARRPSSCERARTIGCCGASVWRPTSGSRRPRSCAGPSARSSAPRLSSGWASIDPTRRSRSTIPRADYEAGGGLGPPAFALGARYCFLLAPKTYGRSSAGCVWPWKAW